MPGHRTYPKHTKLGKLMAARGMKVIQLTVATAIPERSLSAYLAGTRKPTPATVFKLCQEFDCKPEDILEDKYPYTAEDADPDLWVRKKLQSVGHDFGERTA